MMRFHVVSLPILVFACMVIQLYYAAPLLHLRVHTTFVTGIVAGVLIWLFLLLMTREKKAS